MIYRPDPKDFRELHSGVLIKTLTYGDNSLLCELHLTKGAIIPAHQHAEEQSGYLIQGLVRFFGDEGDTILEPGSSWNFKGGITHGVEAMLDSVIVGFYSPVREDFLPKNSESSIAHK